MKQAFLPIIIAALIWSCSGSDAKYTPPAPVTADKLAERWKIVQVAKDSIQNGDLIARFGNDQVSFTFSDFSQKDKSYSHTGIAIAEDSMIYVYHNMANDMNPNEVMSRDLIDSFFNPKNNFTIAVYRYDLNIEEKERLKAIVKEHYRNKLQFDMNFDLETDDKMYCSEMIAKSVSAATNHRIEFPGSRVNAALRSKYMKYALQKNVVPSERAASIRKYIATDDLYLVPQCRQVFKHMFEEYKGPTAFPTPEEYDSLHKK